MKMRRDDIRIGWDEKQEIEIHLKAKELNHTASLPYIEQRLEEIRKPTRDLSIEAIIKHEQRELKRAELKKKLIEKYGDNSYEFQKTIELRIKLGLT